MGVCVYVYVNCFFRTCCSSCGVCKFIVRFTWLCMPVI